MKKIAWGTVMWLKPQMHSETGRTHDGEYPASTEQTIDERRLRDVIESRPLKVGNEECQLRLVGLSVTPNNAVMIAIAIGCTAERLQLQLSDDLRRDPIALRQRIVYFAKRMVTTARENGPKCA